MTAVRSRRFGALLIALALGLGLVASSGTFATAQTPTARATKHVIDDGPWPPFTAPWDAAYKAYNQATGTDKTLLARIALRPRVMWVTSQSENGAAEQMIKDRIQEFQEGDTNAYTQVALFGLWPHGESHRSTPLTATQQATYKTWINQIAAGIGSSKVIMVLEPDLAVAWGGWRPAVRFGLAAYAAKKLGALPNTTIYLDSGDSEWLKAAKAVKMLKESGIRYVDGIALGATHYTSTASNIEYGTTVLRKLAAAGISGKSMVIDTADNGRPFSGRVFHKQHPNTPESAARLCASTTDSKCMTLGIPPTTDVTSPQWHLSAADNALAATYVDAYLWIGRPWQYHESAPFELSRALAVASSTPYPN